MNVEIYRKSSQTNLIFTNKYLQKNTSVQQTLNEKTCKCKFRVLIVDDSDFNLCVLQ